MATPEQLFQVMNKEHINFERMQMLYQGNFKIFDGHALGGDAQEMANTRENLHALLDSMLDSSAIISMMRRKLGDRDEWPR